MSWATRRRLLYALGVFLFFAITVGGPIAYSILTIPPTCTDGIQNQGETAVDLGGPCPFLDPAQLQPSAVLWARTFAVRDGSFSAVAYIDNPNDSAGIGSVSYQFKLYDDTNVLVADRTGSTFVMPGRVTPVFEPAIPTGNRKATHAFFAITSPLRWQQMTDAARAVAVSEVASRDVSTTPRVSAVIRNTSVATLFDIAVVATVFDTAGNAYAASSTRVPRLAAGDSQQVVFTWPDPFPNLVGRIDVIPLLAPHSTATSR